VRKCLILCLCVLLLSLLVSQAFAVEGGHYRVNVMIAYDEEWECTANDFYGYSAFYFAKLILTFVNDYFSELDIRFTVVSVRSWDSDDNPESDLEMLMEAVTETNFTSGMLTSYPSGVPIDILVAFTGQDIPNCYGRANSTLGVVLVRHWYLGGIYNWQITDNILQHELSHLYGAEHHYVDRECVMTMYEVWIPFPLNNWLWRCMLTNEWCEDCRTLIHDNRDLWGVWSPLGGGGGDEECPY